MTLRIVLMQLCITCDSGSDDVLLISLSYDYVYYYSVIPCVLTFYKINLRVCKRRM